MKLNPFTSFNRRTPGASSEQSPRRCVSAYGENSIPLPCSSSPVWNRGAVSSRVKDGETGQSPPHGFKAGDAEKLRWPLEIQGTMGEAPESCPLCGQTLYALTRSRQRRYDPCASLADKTPRGDNCPSVQILRRVPSRTSTGSPPMLQRLPWAWRCKWKPADRPRICGPSGCRSLRPCWRRPLRRPAPCWG
ncbi:hypothetical protein DSECCO2_217070 [anaerobic digester metagenome]